MILAEVSFTHGSGLATAAQVDSDMTAAAICAGVLISFTNLVTATWAVSKQTELFVHFIAGRSTSQ